MNHTSQRSGPECKVYIYIAHFVRVPRRLNPPSISVVNALSFFMIRDPTDPILDAGPVQGRLRGWGHLTESMEAKIMKYHGLSWSFGKILPEDQNWAKLLYGYAITRTSKKSWFIVLMNLHIFTWHRPSLSFIRQFSASFTREKFTLSIYIRFSHWVLGRHLGPRGWTAQFRWRFAVLS